MDQPLKPTFLARGALLEPAPPLFAGSHRLIILDMMRADMEKMIDERTDAVLGFEFESIKFVSRLSDSDVERLGSARMKIAALRQRVKDEKEGEVTPATVEMICDDSVTVRLLKEAGIVSIADLIETEPTILARVLALAEMENGHVRQHHLLLCRWYKTRRKFNQALRKLPEKKPDGSGGRK